MRLLYTVVYALVFFLTLPYWLLRSKINHKHFNFRARFLGPGRLLPKMAGQPRVWLWALSMGEVMAAKNLVIALEEAGCEVIISATTQNGRETAQKLLPGRLILSSPMDFDISTSRFLDAVDPDLMVLIETDIWPGILWRLEDRHLPAALVSTRISPRSLKAYGYIKFFWGSVLRELDLITAQNPEDRERLIALGANQETTVVTGDLKFDQDVVDFDPGKRETLLKSAGWPEGRWLVAGSIHMGEDALMLDTFEQLLPKYPDLKLLLAPRNKSDFEAVWHLIKKRGLTAAHRNAPQPDDMHKKIFILDTLGELSEFYDLAEIAMVGKSWNGQHKGGGHNPLEPASKAVPVLFGPLTHNFRWMTRALVENGGGLMVSDQPALAAALDDLLSNPEKAKEMGQKAKDFIKIHQGSVNRVMDHLKPFIDQARTK